MMPISTKNLKKKLRKSVDNLRRSRGRRASIEEISRHRRSISLSESNTECPLCNQPFEQQWDKNIQEWFAVDAICIDKIYHKKCYDAMLVTGSFGNLLKRPASVRLLEKHVQREDLFLFVKGNTRGRSLSLPALDEYNSDSDNCSQSSSTGSRTHSSPIPSISPTRSYRTKSPPASPPMQRVIGNLGTSPPLRRVRAKSTTSSPPLLQSRSASPKGTDLRMRRSSGLSHEWKPDNLNI